MRYKIAVIGAYGEGNIGDDALMLSMYNILIKYFEISDICFIVSSNDKYLKQLIPEVDIFEKKHMFKLNSEILIYGGGTQFFSFRYDESESSIRNLMRKIYIKVKNINLYQYIYKKKFAMQELSNVKHYFALGIGLGPFYDGKENKYKTQLLKFDFVALRDKKSLEYTKKWKIGKVFLGADICYKTTNWIKKQPEYSRVDKKKKVGIIIRDWKHVKNGMKYLLSLEESLPNLKKMHIDYEYILFSKNDVECAQTVHINKNRIWDPTKFTIDEFIISLTEFDLIISARYHGIVLLASLGVPCISIEIEPKLKEVATTLNSTIGLWEAPYQVNDLLNLIKKYINLNNIELKNNIYKQEQAVDFMINNMYAKFDELLRK